MLLAIACLIVGFVWGGMLGFRAGDRRGYLHGRAEVYRELGNEEETYPRVHR